MPIDDYPVKLTGPETHRLADMAGVQWDLQVAAATAEQLKRRRTTQSNDLMMLEAFQDSALIHYGRAFSTGVRDKFVIPRTWIAELPPDLREGHQYFLDLRDRHIAHSVNDWELNIPVARIRVDRKTGVLDVHQVTVNKSRVVLSSSESLDKLSALAKILADRVDDEMRIEKARLLEFARAIPPEELKRRILEDAPDIPGTRKVRAPRSRGR